MISVVITIEEREILFLMETWPVSLLLTILKKPIKFRCTKPTKLSHLIHNLNARERRKKPIGEPGSCVQTATEQRVS